MTILIKHEFFSVNWWYISTKRPTRFSFFPLILHQRDMYDVSVKVANARDIEGPLPFFCLFRGSSDIGLYYIFLLARTMRKNLRLILYRGFSQIHSLFCSKFSWAMITVPNYMKSVSWCRLKGAHNWIGETIGSGKMGWGGKGEWEVSLQATRDQGGQGSCHAKRRDSK
jgi:hypothetical protein